MNNLSWMIYAGDIVGNINTALFASFVIFVVWGIIANLRAAEYNTLRVSAASPKPYVSKPFFAAIALLALSTPLPSKSTIYMIAASEMGEKAINTEMASDVFEIVKKEIKKMKEAK